MKIEAGAMLEPINSGTLEVLGLCLVLSINMSERTVQLYSFGANRNIVRYRAILINYFREV